MTRGLSNNIINTKIAITDVVVLIPRQPQRRIYVLNGDGHRILDEGGFGKLLLYVKWPPFHVLTVSGLLPAGTLPGKVTRPQLSVVDNPTRRRVFWLPGCLLLAAPMKPR